MLTNISWFTVLTSLYLSIGFLLQHDQFFVDTVEYAYSVDSLASSHPIDLVVETPDQIMGVFDAISYDKVKRRITLNVLCEVVIPSADREHLFYKCCTSLLERMTS